MDDFSEGIDESAFSPIIQLATALHEMYLALTSSGFTENQALYIASKMIIREDDFDNMTDDTDR
jgi:hypothetical protein